MSACVEELKRSGLGIVASVWHLVDGGDFPEGGPAPIVCGRQSGAAIIFPGSPVDREPTCPECKSTPPQEADDDDE